MKRSGGLVSVDQTQVEELLGAFYGLLGRARLGASSSRLAVERSALAFDEWSYGRLRGYELLAATSWRDPTLSRLRQVTATPAYFLSSRAELAF